MKKRSGYPRNPLARGMSYDNRLKRFYQDKDKLLAENIGVPAAELQEKYDRLIAWWNV